MNNLIEFGRVFLSYGLLLLIIVAVGTVAFLIGTKIAKNKNKKNEEA